MKTLDEVINELQYWDTCDEFPESFYDFEVTRDALHYLEAYRQLSNGTSQKLRNTSQITCPKCHSEFVILDDPDGDHQQLEKCRALLQDFYRNDPLTWDELRQMEDKPVWWETYDPIDEKTGWHNAYWRLIEFINDEHIYVRDSDGEQDCFYKSESEYWQAYRKERE